MSKEKIPAVVTVPIAGVDMVAMKDDAGQVWVALKRACEALGVNWDGQRKTLSEKSWATTVVKTAVAFDGRVRTQVFADRKTFLMWLATLCESRIKNPQAKQIIIRVQAEAATVLDRYFGDGETFEADTVVETVEAATPTLSIPAGDSLSVAERQMRLLNDARGLVPTVVLEPFARRVLEETFGTVEPDEQVEPTPTLELVAEPEPVMYSFKQLAERYLPEPGSAWSLSGGLVARCKKRGIKLEKTSFADDGTKLARRDVRTLYPEAAGPILRRLWEEHLEWYGKPVVADAA